MDLTGQAPSWVRKAVNQILTGQDGIWRKLLDITREYLDGLEDCTGQIPDFQISGLDNRDRHEVRNDVLALLRHLEAGGKLGFGPFTWPRPKVVKKYLITEIRVDGELCIQPHPLKKLIEWIEIADRLDNLQRHWEEHLEESPSNSFLLR